MIFTIAVTICRQKASNFVVILSKIVLLPGYKKNYNEGRKRLVYDESYKSNEKRLKR